MAIQPLAQHDLTGYNTLGFAAQAEYFVSVHSESELLEALQWAEAQQLPVTLIGGGSNLVIAQDVAGLVIQIAILGRSCTGHSVCVGAGESWHETVRWSVEDCQLQGLESLALIPGTVGAAPVQNIGAYGVELADLDPVVRAYDREQQTFVELNASQSQYAYRDSLFKAQRDRYVITQVQLTLHQSVVAPVRYPDLRQELGGLEHTQIQDLMQAVVRVRQRKLPDPAVLGNAGSFFKNPIVDADVAADLREHYPNIPNFDQPKGVKLSAAWLIDQCGWKGYRQGGVGVSPTHALVLVHYGHEKGQALMDLASTIQDSVKERFGVQLEPEPRIL